MRLGRRHIGFVELDRRAIESARGVTALAFDLRLLVARQSGAYIVRGGFITDLDGGGRRARGFERIRYDQRNVLAVIANDVVFERWTRLVHITGID